MQFQRIITLTLSIIWLITSWYTLAYMNSISAAMDSGCPLMSHETMFCPMTLAQHIDRWDNLFLGICPLLILLAGLISLYYKSPHNELVLLSRQQLQRWRRHWLAQTPPLASFIYRGLLQPKLYS